MERNLTTQDLMGVRRALYRIQRIWPPVAQVRVIAQIPSLPFRLSFVLAQFSLRPHTHIQTSA